VRTAAAVEGAKAGEAVTIVVNQTPFYAEAGGQVGDTGTLKTDTGAAMITDTKKVAGVFLHMSRRGDRGRDQPGPGRRA
jgi:alanyl-tRNA synthetase